MNFRILGKPINDEYPTYRGLYREEPMYIDSDKVSKSVNQLWAWYADEAGDGGYINDPDKAKELISLYQGLGYHFELIRINSQPDLRPDEEFLGIDICTIGGYSLLSFGLNYQDLFRKSSVKTNIESIFTLVQK